MDGENFSLASHAIVIPLLSIIVIILDLPPFSWHLKNRNLGAASLIFWIILTNIFTTVNALIWPNADIKTWWHGEILCDIEVKLGMGSHLGICGSLVCIMRSLAQVLNTSNAALSPTRGQRRKQLIIDIMLCFGFPAFEMAIHYVIQPSRYYIFPIGGCTVSFDNSWPSIVIYHIWAPILCFVVVYYAGECSLQISHKGQRLTRRSASDYPHAQVSSGIRSSTGIVQFEPDKVSLPTLVPPICGHHRGVPTVGVIRSLSEY